MRKYLKGIAAVMLPLFACGYIVSCTPTQLNTAKNVVAHAEFYVDLAEALVKVAATFVDKEDVKAALEATVQALATVKKLAAVAKSGLDKDEEALKAAVIELAIEVFVLAQAIKKAQSAKKATTT